jgi:hypothetical protein
VEDGGEGSLRAGNSTIENRGNDIRVAIITLRCTYPNLPFRFVHALRITEDCCQSPSGSLDTMSIQ